MKTCEIGIGIRLLVWLLAVSACDSDSQSDPAIEPSSRQPGEPCEGHLDCAPIEGKEVLCRCTDDASVPVCDVLSNAGESCEITGSFQKACASGLGCSYNFDDSKAVCVPLVGVGEACSDANAACGSELVCEEGVCAQGMLGLGESCFEDSDCQSQLRCEFLAGCVERIPVGESCADVGVPSARTCVEGSACEGFSETCVPLKADGAECFWDIECSSGECVFGGCGHDHRIPDGTSLHCGF